MLYKIIKSEGSYEGLEPQPFDHLPLEKDLEELLADHLMGSLELLPFFQERRRQEEADIYALNRDGDVVIFELKRADVGGDAVHQILRYADQSALWDYNKIAGKYKTYQKSKPSAGDVELIAAHQEAFDLDEPLNKSVFNKKQHLIIVGYAGSNSLIQKVNYWKTQGLKIDFIPYRVYKLGGESYFEFFSLPFDQHQNPAHRKGVMFDTCRMEDNWSLAYMVESDRVAAYNERDGAVYCFNEGDTALLYHRGLGIVGAGKVTSKVKDDPDFLSSGSAKYCDIEWLTPKPDPDAPVGIPSRDIEALLEQGFFWARIDKTPYLSTEQSDILVRELNTRFSPNADTLVPA